VITLAGMSRFVVADFSNAKEVRAEVLQVQSQYRRVPIIPIAQHAADLPVTMANVFDEAALKGMLRYTDVDDLQARLDQVVVEPAEARVAQAAQHLARAVAFLRST
jgi:hypothetical protein